MNVMALSAFYINLSEIRNDCFKSRNLCALDKSAHKCGFFFYGADGDVARLGWSKPVVQFLA